jgi:hypothetical protein
VSSAKDEAEANPHLALRVLLSLRERIDVRAAAIDLGCW